MKFIKILHAFFGIIPFAWLLSFLTILLIATIHFGYIPKYGNPIDPSALGLDQIEYVEVILAFCAFISFFIWTFLSLIFIFFKSKIQLSKLPIFLFVIGVCGFFVLRYEFTDIFLWVVD
jgi:hypothetical protein